MGKVTVREGRPANGEPIAGPNDDTMHASPASAAVDEVAPTIGAPLDGEADDRELPARPSSQRETLRASEARRGLAIEERVADRYRRGTELGRGGMGRVVEAYDQQLGRTVALKEVLPRAGSAIAKRFAREVQLTARLEHPSIIPLYDAGTTPDGLPYYVMRRVSGRPLDQLMQATQLTERLTLLPALLAAIDAVAHAHRRGVIHRDLKPANILVGELGETVVIDWGLAKLIGEADDAALGSEVPQAGDSLHTQIGSVFGTPGFMSPEQARGEELDPRGDVYALGAILYQLLAGAPPHAGTSATEVIANTGSRAVAPVHVAAPGAPADLVAIVGKALAFDAAARYADAGALGEDVRRFLSGQLVAAHHYTKWQHVARFARRHRAPLGVAALAMVAVAVLAWLGVHRIVHERDAAEAARLEADRQTVEAHKQRDLARRRADQLLVSEARSLVDRNPTHAAAVLKEVSETSERMPEARAVAQAAIARGVAWTMPLPDELTIFAELSPDAKFLAQSTRDGQVRVWDLERRGLVIARPYAPGTRAIWAGAALLVFPLEAPPVWLDPFTGAWQALALPASSWASSTRRGDKLVAIANHDAYLVDVATRAAQPLWPAHRGAIDHAEIADDGSWIALADAERVVVLDAAGRELSSRPGHPIRMFVNPDAAAAGALAVFSADEVAVFSPKLGWRALPARALAPAMPIDLVFRGDELAIYASSGKVLGWNLAEAAPAASTASPKPPTLRQRLATDGFTPSMRAGDRGLVFVPGTDGQIRFYNDLITGALHLPVPLTYPKFYARAGAPRVIALGAGMLVGFELGDSLPAPLTVPRDVMPEQAGMQAVFVDDETLLLWRIQGGAWVWYDVRTRRATPFEYDPRGMPSVVDVDPVGGRVLIAEVGDGVALYELRKHTAEQRLLIRAPRAGGRLLPGDGFVFSVGDARVLAVDSTRHAHEPGAEEPREVAKLDGGVDALAPIGDHGFAALSVKGEVVRGDLATGALSRSNAAPGGTSAIVADRRGRVYVALDDRLMRWDRDLAPIARLDQRIVRLSALADAVLVELADHSVVRVELDASGSKATTHRAAPPSDRSPLISADGKLVVARSVNDQLVAVETAPIARWDLPVYYTSQSLLSIAPTTRRFVQDRYGLLALWSLPLAPQELRPWLDERTNAVTSADGDRDLTWTWQTGTHGAGHP